MNISAPGFTGIKFEPPPPPFFLRSVCRLVIFKLNSVTLCADRRVLYVYRSGFRLVSP
jgi:hypothetical protein